jgi:hypothetical protein
MDGPPAASTHLPSGVPGEANRTEQGCRREAAGGSEVEVSSPFVPPSIGCHLCSAPRGISGHLGSRHHADGMQLEPVQRDLSTKVSGFMILVLQRVNYLVCRSFVLHSNAIHRA